MRKPIRLEDLEIYQLAMEIGEHVWSIVDKWDYFQRKTLGNQFVSAADSIAANISEGYGRYHYKDKRMFYYYSRGSLLETKTWMKKSANRNLIDEEIEKNLNEKLKNLHYKLNAYIKSLRGNIEKS